MSKVDLDKFIVDYVKYSNIQEALKQQGLKCSGDEIVELSQVNEDEKIMKEIAEFIYISVFKPKDIKKKEKWLTWFEKQGNKLADKVESKFKVGDYIKNVNDKREPIYEIVYMDKECYICEYRGKENIGDKAVMHFAFDNPYLRLVEQNPADKIEPKFHEGDWIVYKNDICQIVKREEGCNKLVTTFGIEKELVNERNLSTARHWTIQDAKDGDVLACNINKAEIGGDIEKLPNIIPTICVYQNIVKDKDYIHTYCSLYNGSSLVLSNSMYYNTFVYNIQPSTKEQRELLLSKMKEAGYEFNFKKKELKKIHVIDEGKAEMDYCFTKMMNGEKVSSAWSEEDMSNVQRICRYLDEAKKYYADITEVRECMDWLKSLKDRVQPQLQPTWSEEDKSWFEEIELMCLNFSNDTCYRGEFFTWLKSLKDKVQHQNRWKPSKEQIIALRWVLNNIPYNKHKEEISGLLDQIKDL